MYDFIKRILDFVLLEVLERRRYTMMDYKQLINSAIAAKEMAYAPYSNFRVGAAVLTDSDKIYTGCNIENASFGATNCAERTAIFKAISEGEKLIKAIAIIGDIENYTFPCGICRQVIVEFAENEEIDVILIRNKGDYIIKTMKELLPGAFTRKDLHNH
jgi:cytidine deaminase